jgi:hypothetical protein
MQAICEEWIKNTTGDFTANDLWNAVEQSIIEISEGRTPNATVKSLLGREILNSGLVDRYKRDDIWNYYYIDDDDDDEPEVVPKDLLIREQAQKIEEFEKKIEELEKEKKNFIENFSKICKYTNMQICKYANMQ